MGYFMENINFIFILVPIFIFIVFFITIVLISSILVKRVRTKLFGIQIDRAKQMLGDNKVLLKNMSEDLINFKSEFLEENEDLLKQIKIKEAEIDNEELKIKAKTVKDTFSDTMNCKYCGASIASDSKYCNICGKDLSK